MKNILAVTALFCFAIFAAACGAPAANTGTNNTNAKPANTAPANTATNTSTSEAPKTDANKTETAADSVGVPECDEYIKKYEACLTSIAAKSPAVEGPMKTAFQAQRDGFKKSAETPQGKTALAGICKQAIETAKESTKAYACTW